MLQTLFFISLGRIFVRAFCLQRRVAVSYQRSVGSIYLFTTLPGWALGQTGGKERGCWPGPVSCALGIRGKNFMRRAAAVAVVVLVL